MSSWDLYDWFNVIAFAATILCMLVMGICHISASCQDKKEFARIKREYKKANKEFFRTHGY